MQRGYLHAISCDVNLYYRILLFVNAIISRKQTQCSIKKYVTEYSREQYSEVYLLLKVLL